MRSLLRFKMTHLVNEIFYSIQGESLSAGRPCIFIRLTGCNLRCAYCDTAYAYEEGVAMDTREILDRISTWACRLVEVTGGEPLIQAGTPGLIDQLLENGYEVLLETNGSMDIGGIDPRCIKIVDIKCPASRESDKNDFKNLKRLTVRDQIKFVIANRTDYDYAKQIIQKTGPDMPESHILFSPVCPVMAPEKLSRWILDDQLNVRLHLQLHKILWPGRDRGV
ncbi:MAG: radical SAM protein [Desulfobacterales bacterium]|nr:radical SAM protein [Desulfobacterales bacterium]